MKIHKTGLGRGVVVAGMLLTLSCLQAQAQTTAAQSAAEQTKRVPARVTQSVDDTNRVALRGNVHPHARAEFDRGAVADAQPVTRIMLLFQRSAEQEAALRQLMEEQQAKGSANYHAWLTPEDFGKKFGPADADVQAVTDWLTSRGFQNIKVSKGKAVVEFSGNVGQVRNAFGTEIHKYNVNGKEHFANVSDPQIPAALAPVLRGVVALHNFRPKPMYHRLGTFQRNTKTGEVKPALTFTDVNGTFYAMGPADFATIYNIPAGATGAGQSIAIVGQSNINIADVTAFRSIFGLQPYASTCTGVPGQCSLTVILNGPDPGLVSGDEGESDLDVEWAGAVAPAATIDFVVTESTDTDATAGIDGSALYIVDNNVAPILSESYGACESGLGTAGNAFYNALWQQAAAEGITVVISAGDNGSAGCDTPDTPASGGVAVSGLASTPFNVAMGGTDFDDANNQTTFWNAANTSTTPPVLASAKGYIPETTWNDSCAGTGITGCAGLSSTATTLNSVAGSGGPSSVYTKPSWQTGLTSDSARDLPDVSLFSSDGQNKTFYIVCQSDQDIPGDTGCDLNKFVTTSPFHDFQAVGGTSAATPTFAGIVALINQKLATGGNPTPRQGNVNYVLYGLAKTAANVCNSTGNALPNACVFNDVTKGNVSVACVGGSANCSNTATGTTQFGAMATTKGGTTPAFNAGAGYDLATGLGSVNVANLLINWTAPSRTGSTTTLVIPSTAVTVDTPVAVSGAVAPGTATGLVTLFQGSTSGPVIDTFTLSGGAFSANTSFLPGGSYNVIAHYGGDGTFAASDSAPMPVTVNPQGSQTVVSFVTFSSTNVPTLNTGAISVPYGSPYILRVDVKNSGGQTCQNLTTGAVGFLCPTGTVTLTSNGSALNDFPNAQTPNVTNTAKLNDRGFAEDQPIQLAPGIYSIVASYSGDSSYGASTSTAESVTITKATTTAKVTSNVSSIVSGGSVTLTALISSTSNGAGLTGTVQFKNGSSNLGVAATCTPSAAGAAAAASCTATLTTTLSQLVPFTEPRPRLRIPSIPLWIAAWLLILLLAMARYAAPLRNRRPRLGYAVAGLALFACVAAGFAGCSGSGSSSSGGGTHTDSITAVYSGDANYAGSTSPAATVTVQ